MKNTKKTVIPRVAYIGGIALILVIAIIFAVTTLSGKGKKTPESTDGQTEPVYARISIRDYGDITLELYPDIAPITVANFTKLVNDEFYDGLTFHRIISGFMIQGGDPNGNGTGGSSENIKGEFAANGVQNDLKHTRGVISMARSSMPDSASSQFFIMHQDAPHLDGSYAAFGKVISGMETVDAICEKVPVTDRNGTVMKNDQPVITSIRMITAEEAVTK